MRKIKWVSLTAAVLMFTGFGGAVASADGKMVGLGGQGHICKKFNISGSPVADICFWWKEGIRPNYEVAYQFQKLSWGGYLPSGHWANITWGPGSGYTARMKATGERVTESVPEPVSVVVCHSTRCSDRFRLDL
ncbi:hypothetical protein AB5J62_20045 [Amycolatopsis sp. cg5]|uniref:hypothetical protein n=1 Tax=Amycolatopsis sp. cg5 TaxID=3238802 RepID=UPI0035243970